MLRQLVLTAERTVTRAGDMKEVLTAQLRLENAPCGCKQNLSSAMSMWSGADVCPASGCGRSHAAAPYGSLRIGSITLTRA
jgi:hypothetical protein